MLAWLAAGMCGAAYALWAMAEALRKSCTGVDVIAVLALVGPIAVGEPLAAAVISVMLTSGRVLEDWAAGGRTVTCTPCWSARPGPPGATAARRSRQCRWT